ncbi:50S ribosomal protein L6 [Candidatus Berkelbacteria bacterium]|nr:50S ribosomal protein L6 [Candidatus Berkelbacteria bacterium]
MSRLAKRPIQLPDGVSAALTGQDLVVTGPKGEVRVLVPFGLPVSVNGQAVVIDQASARTSAVQGLVARLLLAAIAGVTEGYTIQLEIQGVGYRAQMQGKDLVLNVGFSHPVSVTAPEGVELAVQKSTISVSGIDKQLVGQVAANIRRIKPPEPYKGKGIRYVGEQVRRKAGKAAKAAGAA